MSTAIQKATEGKAVAKKAPSTIRDYISVMAPAIKAALPSVMTPERFTRITLSALSTNPKLQECTPASFLGAMMTAAQLGLEPNTPLGQAYLIPFLNRKTGQEECQFQLGYKGLLDLAYRSGEVSVVQAHTVRENDDFQYELGLEPKLRHVPATADRGAAIAYYAMFRTKDGGYGFNVMTKDEVLQHARQYSKSYGSGPWQTRFDEMAKKTVLKRVLKYAPLKSDFARGLSQDGAVKDTLSDDMSEVPNVIIDAEPVAPAVDETTGEVIENKEEK